MSDKKIHLKITTHEKVVFEGDVDEVYSKSTQGEFGILHDHLPFMCPLDIGVTKVVADGKHSFYTTMGGVFQIQNNDALILTQAAENAEEIDIERAAAAKQRAEERLTEDISEVDVDRAEISLARAMARLKATKK